METGIYIGNKISKTTADSLQSIIAEIFRAGYENRMDQSTIVEALKLVGRITEVKDISLNHVSVHGDNIVQETSEETDQPENGFYND